MNRAYRNIALRLVLLVVVSIAGVSAATAQYFPERGLVREGNKQFERRNFRSALNRYEEALEHDSLSYEAQYNRANASAQYLINNPSDTTRRTERWRLSNAYYETLAADSLLSDVERAEVLRNLGESLFAQQQYEAALNSFRESLLLNADDSETKNNYVLTKRIVDQKRRMQQQNQNQQGGGGDNQQQDQNQQQDNKQQDQNQQNNDPNSEGENNKDKEQKSNDQNEDKNDQNKDKQDQNKQNEDKNDNSDDKGDNKEEQNDNSDDQNDNSDKDGSSNTEQSPTPRGISREEQERMLDAIQEQEDKTQDKLKDEKRGVYIPGKKNW
ncbi:MAG: tetratricopeptide repeat protein [Alistipes sp.]|nr:tetratricopeptide repeat protein [Alistipes sp.]